MRTRSMQWTMLLSGVVVMGMMAVGGHVANADPCGMVPPYFFKPGGSINNPPLVAGQPAPSDAAIMRVGQQRTYVFHHNGVETFVIRPGFSGKVDEFGMLIPFPEAPSIRKVSDDIFEHIAAAIDPPEVSIDLHSTGRKGGASLGRVQMNGLTDEMQRQRQARAALKARRQQVTVLSEEAVGMYDVAVLEAGSGEALSRWMTSHNYHFPKGMKNVCDDYIKEDWCFVAVKTRVGTKSSVDPKPGQRNVEAGLPADATFDGYVQAMGFRFRSKDLVVPMRLSTYNEGDLNNIVYLLTDGPSRIKGISGELVKRQVPGKDLYRNVMGRLPVRCISDSIASLKKRDRKKVEAQRDPAMFNRHAKDLFASDLLAAQHKKLAVDYEKDEKVLQDIGEHLDMRGKDLDRMHADALARKRLRVATAALKTLNGMTLTIIDGEYPRDVLARDNLHFEEYAMHSSDNGPLSYDANTREAQERRTGTLYYGDLPTRSSQKRTASSGHPASALLLLVGLGMVVALRKKKDSAQRLTSKAVAAGILFSLVAVQASVAEDEKPGDDQSAAAVGEVDAEAVAAEKARRAAEEVATNAKVKKLMRGIGRSKSPEVVVDQLIQLGEPAITRLSYHARSGKDMAPRGWAILAIAQIGGERADVALAEIVKSKRQPELVRNWALAARVRNTATMEEVDEMVTLVRDHPATQRALFSRLKREMSAEAVFALALGNPGYLSAVGPMLGEFSNEELAQVLVYSELARARQLAAQYISRRSSATKGIGTWLKRHMTAEEILTAAAADTTTSLALRRLTHDYPPEPFLEIVLEADAGSQHNLAASFLEGRGDVQELLQKRIDEGKLSTDQLLEMAVRTTAHGALFGPLLVDNAPEVLTKQLGNTEDLTKRSQVSRILATSEKGRELMRKSLGDKTIHEVAALAAENNTTGQVLAPVLLESSNEELADVMLQGKTAAIRRLAAGLIASRPPEEHEDVIAVITSALSYDEKRDVVPWNNGALFLPSVTYTKDSAQRLVIELVRWHAACGKKQLTSEQSKIDTALMNGTLLSAGQYRAPRRSAKRKVYQWRNMLVAVHGEAVVKHWLPR